MINFKNFLIEKALSQDVESDDKGKLHELLLAKHLHPENRLPDHHRSHSENPDYAGTPIQVHDKLKNKIGDAAYNEIDQHAKDTANALVQHLIDNGHVKSKDEIHNVHWTSNADRENNPGDHEKTTGIRDVNSNADLILSTKNKKNPFIGVSAKYGKNKPNYRNAGLNSLESIAGLEPGTHTDVQKKHEDAMEAIGYSGTKKQRHSQFKLDKAILEAEKKKHKENGGASGDFEPSHPDAKKADLAEKLALRSRQEMARNHEQGMSKLSDDQLRDYVRNEVSAPTKFKHVVAHSKVNDDGSSTPIIKNSETLADDHLGNFHNLHVRKGNGISADIMGTHKDTGKVQIVASQGFKGTSGPHKGTAGMFGLNTSMAKKEIKAPKQEKTPVAKAKPVPGKPLSTFKKPALKIVAPNNGEQKQQRKKNMQQSSIGDKSFYSDSEAGQ